MEERGSTALAASATEAAATSSSRHRRHRVHRPRPRPFGSPGRRSDRRRRRLDSPSAGAAAAAELGADRAFADAEELIASDGIDVVHICTPNHLHLPLAIAALEAGKHVVVEKPLALDAAGAAEIAAAADAAGLVATVPFAYRYYPMVREARERVRAGSLGELRLLHGGYLQDWLLGADDDNWRVDAELGGASRAFADIGSHWCDLIEFVFGSGSPR